MIPCKCGLLKRYASDLDVPILSDSRETKYFVEAVPGTAVELSCCFFCGGEFGSNQSKSCQCGQPAKWAAVENSVLKFDPSVGEFYIKYAETRLSLYYCPFCCGLLPESQNDNLFVEPSPNEISDIRQKLLGVTSVAQVVSAIGTPDERRQRTETDAKDESIYNVLPIRETLLYKSILRSAYLCIQETMDGKILVSILKKEKTA